MFPAPIDCRDHQARNLGIFTKSYGLQVWVGEWLKQILELLIQIHPWKNNMTLEHQPFADVYVPNQKCWFSSQSCYFLRGVHLFDQLPLLYDDVRSWFAWHNWISAARINWCRGFGLKMGVSNKQWRKPMEYLQKDCNGVPGFQRFNHSHGLFWVLPKISIMLLLHLMIIDIFHQFFRKFICHCSNPLHFGVFAIHCTPESKIPSLICGRHFGTPKASLKRAQKRR